MKNKTIFFIIFLFVISSLNLLYVRSVDADGGAWIAADFEEHVYLPYQKAAIIWDGTNETMILSTKISSENFSDIAWIVPILSNSTPIVEQGDIEIFNNIADNFGEYVYTSTSMKFFYFEFFLVSLVFLIVSILILVLAIIKRNNRSFVLLIVLFVVFLVISSFFMFLFIYSSGMGATSADYKNVEVIEMKKIDIYDVAVLQATNASEMLNWLDDNEFFISQASTSILEEYCNSPNYYFIVNKINFSNKYSSQEDIQQAKSDLKKGISTPLMIRFQPEKPFYPMHMTSVNAGETKINVYFISDRNYIDESNILSTIDASYDRNGYIHNYIYENNIGNVTVNDFDYITWLSYEGDTEDLVTDSYFI